jgi:hypothetical protein
MNLSHLSACLMFSLLLSSPVSWSGVGATESQADSVIHEILAAKISQRYEELFIKSVEKYNSKREDLPLLRVNRKGVAETTIGPHSLSFNSATLYEGYVLVNEKKLNLRNVDIKDVQNILTTKKTTSTILDFFISRAYAQGNEFELLLFKTVISVKRNFKDFSCWLDKCEMEQTRHNFELVMKEIKDKAEACKANPESDEIDEFAYRLTDYMEYQSGKFDLQMNLEKSFNNYPESELTCQKFVEHAYADEVMKRTSGNERRGYGGVSSVEAMENGETNDQQFKAYIQSICQPYTELRNCLVQNRFSAQTRIYNQMRSEGKEAAPGPTYRVAPRGSSATRQ